LETAANFFALQLIRHSRQVEDVPCWLRIINGEIYNEEEFLKFFRVPRHMFLT